ncbi:putative type II secretion system protein E [Pseudobythopirellula maris]|uniref:Putative type II secretion system protein E n=1 Tax=Pseudobythopirellula maris TaxID=2527991 RepID=A0A5C5ZRX5_9BACT|nr:ATPase, T2SS/T4P/T4SS family [Pseudobythopirellula maris]TWT89845.1 putative type II secretion system protein E [Pseudobythopirellula maris]
MATTSKKNAPKDEWFFEIGDGQVYGPFTFTKLQKWAESGDLMPTHRVREGDEGEWIIAAYVPGLELTVATPHDKAPATPEKQDSFKASLDYMNRKLGRAKKAETEAPADDGANYGNPSALCDELLETAFERRASDIHIDPEEHILLVQFRVDGGLEAYKKYPKRLHASIIGRMKVLAKMDIAERRMPQDGRFTYELGPHRRKVDIRAACLPTTHGERLTLRLLSIDTEALTLNKLGMEPATHRLFADAVGMKQGMVLLTGPTGSGKSTTLYAALRHRLGHHPGRVITIEDPVEFDIVGVAQVEVDTADKVRFDTALRNILRSDPDVIMIGEIRDYDSADIAIKASLTGHLVLSSLHTNSAASVVTRLVDMGVPPYLVASTLRLCVAQRLVRRLCQLCRKPHEMSEAEAAGLGRPELTGQLVYEPKGCATCQNRGYKGRLGLFEMLPIDTEFGRIIVNGCDEIEIVEKMQQRGITLLADDAVNKLTAGLTSYAEAVSLMHM